MHQDWNKDILESMPLPFTIDSYSTYRYKFIMDRVYDQKCYDKYFENIVLHFPYKEISIAVSSAFSPIDNMIKYSDRIDPKLLMLNIFPMDDKYYVIISYRKGHSEIIKSRTNWI